jgi:hypothetical protein
MTDKPRYMFGDVHGALKDGTSVSIGFEGNSVSIAFDYRDQDDVLYHVEATGYRTKKESIIADKN